MTHLKFCELLLPTNIALFKILFQLILYLVPGHQAALAEENTFLKLQLNVANRPHKRLLMLDPVELAAICTVASISANWQQFLFICHPDTIIRSHKNLLNITGLLSLNQAPAGLKSQSKSAISLNKCFLKILPGRVENIY